MVRYTAPSWIRISKTCYLFFSSSGQCFAQVSGFPGWSLCNSREGQRQIKFNLILWETPYPYECHSPVAYMHIHRCTHWIHTSMHVCAHMHMCVHRRGSPCTQLFARDFLLHSAINLAGRYGYQRGKRTGEALRRRLHTEPRFTSK